MPDLMRFDFLKKPTICGDVALERRDQQRGARWLIYVAPMREDNDRTSGVVAVRIPVGRKYVTRRQLRCDNGREQKCDRAYRSSICEVSPPIRLRACAIIAVGDKSRSVKSLSATVVAVSECATVLSVTTYWTINVWSDRVATGPVAANALARAAAGTDSWEAIV